MRRKTGCDSFESAPPRERVRPWYFNSRFKTENSKERFSMHHCLTKGLAILAASALTLFPMYQASAEDKDGSSTKTPIKHLVVIFQENVSFDHYFGTYPHANGLSHDLLTNNPNGVNPRRYSPSNLNDILTCDQDHSYDDEQKAFDGGKMDKFVATVGNGAGKSPTGQPCNANDVMNYYDRKTVTALWNYAKTFSMSD